MEADIRKREKVEKAIEFVKRINLKLVAIDSYS